MSDNDSLRPEDFEPHRVESETRSPRATMTAIFRQNPLLRLAVIILPVILAVVVIIGLFGGSKKVELQSKVASGSNQKDLTNTGTTNESYKKAVDEANKQKIEKAEQTGGSVIVSAPTATAPSNAKAADDPLAAFTQTPVVPITPPPVQAVRPATVAAPPPPPPPPAQKLDQQLAQSFGNEMRTIIGGLNPKPVVITRVTQHVSAPEASSQNDQNQGNNNNSGNHEGPPLVMAGTVLYGQTLTEADSDIPAPILVSVLSGPFQGSRAIGTFQKADEYLILAFGTIIKGKREYHVNAIAMDPETTLVALETDIDHHYFERFVLPAAAGFISGVGTYTQQAGSTVTYSTYGVSQSYPPLNTHQEILSGLGQGANSIANAIQQEANVPITIHVASGTPIGILFVNTVHEVYQ